MSIHMGHRERVRKKIRANDVINMDEHNVLELLLFYTNARGDTNVQAHDLINYFGGFAAVLDAPYEELVKVKGVGEITATFLKLLPQIASYYLKSKDKRGAVINSVAAAGEFFIPFFVGVINEELHMVSLDDRRQVIRQAKISDGIVNSTPIAVKKIISEAIYTNATSIILAHNHPSGIALPSFEDKQMTQKVYEALRQINVSLTDHLIIFNTDFVSLLDSGDFVKFTQKG